jgi:hypothetical protein
MTIMMGKIEANLPIRVDDLPYGVRAEAIPGIFLARIVARKTG